MKILNILLLLFIIFCVLAWVLWFFNIDIRNYKGIIFNNEKTYNEPYIPTKNIIRIPASEQPYASMYFGSNRCSVIKTISTPDIGMKEICAMTCGRRTNLNSEAYNSVFTPGATLTNTTKEAILNPVPLEQYGYDSYSCENDILICNCIK